MHYPSSLFQLHASLNLQYDAPLTDCGPMPCKEHHEKHCPTGGVRPPAVLQALLGYSTIVIADKATAVRKAGSYIQVDARMEVYWRSTTKDRGRHG